MVAGPEIDGGASSEKALPARSSGLPGESAEKKSDDAGKWDRRSPGHQGVTTAGVVTFAVGDFNEWILMTASALSVRGREVPCTNQCFDRS